MQGERDLAQEPFLLKETRDFGIFAVSAALSDERPGMLSRTARVPPKSTLKSNSPASGTVGGALGRRLGHEGGGVS